MWGWVFDHWVPWMLHYPLRPPKQTRPMLKLKLKKIPGSLRGSNTSTNRFRLFYRSPMTSTSSVVINTGYHTSLRWEIKFGCTCRRNALRGPIRIFFHYDMDLTPLPRLWVIILLSSTFPPSLDYIQYLMWTFGHIFHHY
jgi:hypothetical protein